MNIKNEAEKITIELFGDIGESWFDEGHTMQTLNETLKAAKGKPINLIVSSLGGDVSHALAMHDLLKMHDKPVTARIIGATASSGTIVALGANTVEMSENALFLVHNAWTLAMGNANDLRETADELDIWDNRIVNIYKNKTGKRKSQIHSLMEEEKWIDATEAKAFGFIDTTFKPTAQAKILTEEEKQNILNKIKLVMNKEFTEVNNLLNIDGLVIDEEKGAYLQAEQIEAINTALTVDNAEAIATATEELKVQHEAAIGEMQAKIDTLASEKEVGENKLKEVNDKLELTDVEAAEKMEALQAKYNELETAHNSLKAKGMPLGTGEPNIGGEKLTEREKTHKANAERLMKTITKFQPELKK